MSARKNSYRGSVALALLGVALSLTLVACGSIVNKPQSEKRIESRIEQTFNIAVRRVRCPAEVKVETDETYRCTVTTEGGQELEAIIQIANEQADLRVKTLSD